MGHGPRRASISGLKVPVTLVAGYLGAGKTTLINACLKTRGDRRIAVLVNDFGDIGIDAALIRSQTDTVMNLAGGCVCCSIGSDLMDALFELAAMPQSFDHVLIETSGVALPKPIAQSINLSAQFFVESTLLVADAQTVVSQLLDRYVGDTVSRQIDQCDWLLLSQGTRSEMERATQQLKLRWPTKTIACVAADEYSCDWLLGFSPKTTLQGLERTQSTPSMFSRTKPLAAPSVFDSMSFEIEHPVDLNVLSACLQRLAEQSPPKVLRAKGILRSLEAAGQPMLFQMAGSKLRLTRLAATDQGVSALVVIGLKDHLAVDEIIACLSPTNS